MDAITLRYDKPLLRRAVRAFWWRTLGSTYVVACLLLSIVLSCSLWSGDRSWWVGLWGGGLGLGGAFGVALYVVHYRAKMRRFRQMRSPEAIIELGEDRFRVSSELGSSEFLWTTVTEAWAFPEFLLVFVSKAQFITLPMDDLGLQGREFILAKLRANKAKGAWA